MYIIFICLIHVHVTQDMTQIEHKEKLNNAIWRQYWWYSRNQSCSDWGERFWTRLPPINWFVFYLVSETCFYTQQKFKAFKNLEAYNQMVSRFTQSLQRNSIAGKFVVLAKVQHLQNMNIALISVWIITENNDYCTTAHCLGCKAGLPESWDSLMSVSVEEMDEPWSEVILNFAVKYNVYIICMCYSWVLADACTNIVTDYLVTLCEYDRYCLLC